MNPYTVIGLAGVVGYVAAYAALQVDMVDGNSMSYSIANVVAASLVLISLTHDFNLASLLIQIVWIAFGIIGLVLKALRRQSSNNPTISHSHGRRLSDGVSASGALTPVTTSNRFNPFTGAAIEERCGCLRSTCIVHSPDVQTASGVPA